MSKTYNNNFGLVKKNILGVGITDASENYILEYIVNSIRKKEKPYYIVTPNPEMTVLASKNKEFKKALNGAKIALNDGVGVGVAARILGQPLRERIPGVDLVESLCRKVADYPITVGFLGAGQKIAEQTAECLRSKYPRLRVGFIGQEWNNSSSDKKEVVSSTYQVLRKERKSAKIRNTKYFIPNVDVIDILFVAFGAPKQELWMEEHVGKIPVNVLIGVGGAFDYISKKVPRAPRILRLFGLEWLFRLIVQPWRIKRQLALITFCKLVVKQLFKKNEN